MAGFYGYNRYKHRQSGRMFTLRWIATALLACAVILLLFMVLSIIMHIQANRNDEFVSLTAEYPKAAYVIGGTDIVTHTALGTLLLVVCFGTGSTGLALSEKDDATHNISVKNAFLGLCMMTFIAALMYIIGVGALYFFIVDRYFNGDLDDIKDIAEWYYTSFIFVIIFFIIAFFVACLSFVGYFLAFAWRPYIVEGGYYSNVRYGSCRTSSHQQRDEDYYPDHVTENVYPSYKRQHYPYHYGTRLPAITAPYSTYY